MHIPDGFIDGTTSAAGLGLAVAGVGYASRRASAELDERLVPMAGLTTAFIFAMQLVNVPVAGGTSGHLLGGALAAILVGRWAAVLCLTVVVVAQSLVFADGGISAIGLNLLDMALLGPLVGYPAFVLARRVLPRTRAGISIAAGAAGFVGLFAGVAGFVAMYAAGGTSAVPIGTVAGAMVGVHLVIAALEAVLTGLVVGAVVASRPDLVHGAHDLRPAPPAPTPVGAGAA